MWVIILSSLLAAVALIAGIWIFNTLHQLHLDKGLGLDNLLYDILLDEVEAIHDRFAVYGGIQGIVTLERDTVDWVHEQCISYFGEREMFYESGSLIMIDACLKHLNHLLLNMDSEIRKTVVELYIQLLKLARESDVEFSVAGFINWTTINYTYIVNQEFEA